MSVSVKAIALTEEVGISLMSLKFARNSSWTSRQNSASWEKNISSAATWLTIVFNAPNHSTGRSARQLGGVLNYGGG